LRVPEDSGGFRRVPSDGGAQAESGDVRLPGNGNSNSHGARPVHLIITMIKWIRTSRLSIRVPEGALRRGGAGGQRRHVPDGVGCWVYRGTSLIRNRNPLRPYSRDMPRALWWT